MSTKLYIYKNAKSHVHDDHALYQDKVPLSKKGIEKHCKMVDNPMDADYFYMGQFSDGSENSEMDPSLFEYFCHYTTKHICDIEGDWYNRSVPAHMTKCILTMNGVTNDLHGGSYKIFVRPTFSNILVNHCGKTPSIYNDDWRKSFFFRGLPDPFGVRIKIMNILNDTDMDSIIDLNSEWMGPLPLEDDKSLNYIEDMSNHVFLLCPRGRGHDSARFYEACFLGRVPILIGDNRILGQDWHDTSFVVGLSQKESPDEWIKKLNRLYLESDEEIENRCKKSSLYFNEVVSPYLRDPTKSFLDWLNNS